MIVKLYSIYDVKIALYHPPYYLHNKGHALRFFTDEANKPGAINNHPEDYSVYELGEFNDKTGAIISHPQAEFVCNINELIEKKGENGTNN